MAQVNRARGKNRGLLTSIVCDEQQTKRFITDIVEYKGLWLKYDTVSPRENDYEYWHTVTETHVGWMIYGMYVEFVFHTTGSYLRPPRIMEAEVNFQELVYPTGDPFLPLPSDLVQFLRGVSEIMTWSVTGYKEDWWNALNTTKKLCKEYGEVGSMVYDPICEFLRD